MRLDYEVSVDDVVAFNLCHNFFRAPQSRWLSRLMWGLVLAMLLLAAVVAWGARNASPALPLLVGAAFLGVFLGLRRSLIASVVRRQFREPAPGLFGRHTLELADDALIKRTDVGETKTRFSAVGPIVETPTHVFIYLGPVAAHALAREHVVSGDLTAFLAALRLAMAKGQEGAPAFDPEGARRLQTLEGPAVYPRSLSPSTRRVLGDIEGLASLVLALGLWAPLFSPGLIARVGVGWLILPLVLVGVAIAALRTGRSFGRWAAGVALGLLAVQVALVVWVALYGHAGR